MRKQIALLCAAVLLLAGCSSPGAAQSSLTPASSPTAEPSLSPSDAITFTAIVRETGQNTLLVEADPGNSFTLAHVSFAAEMPALSFEPQVGQQLSITILPDIAETDPVQVQAIAITLLAEPATMSAAPADALPEATVLRADACSDEGITALWEKAVNSSTIAISSQKHLPLLVFESADSLQSFLQEANSCFQLDVPYAELGSVMDYCARYDDAFFADNLLFITVISENTGSIGHQLGGVSLQDGTYQITVERLLPKASYTCDMADWFFLLSASRASLQDASAYDAVLKDVETEP